MSINAQERALHGLPQQRQRTTTLGSSLHVSIARQGHAQDGVNGNLSDGQKTQARNALLNIANAARRNTDYRHAANRSSSITPKVPSKFLDLPNAIIPAELVLDDRLNAVAQNQADYNATHVVNGALDPSAFLADLEGHSQTKPYPTDAPYPADKTLYATESDRLNRFGGAGPSWTNPEAQGDGALQDYPDSWMMGDTHFRPWWNLDGNIVTMVGFGIAKHSQGTGWDVVATFGNPGTENELTAIASPTKEKIDSTRSQPISQTPARITFSNKRSKSVKIYWLDPYGSRKFY